MRSMRYVLLGALLCLSVAFAADKKPNFSGTWNINNEKSVVGEGGHRWNASKLTVAQQGNKLSVERLIQRQDGESTVKDTFTLDGKECDNSSDNRRKISHVNWLKDTSGITFTTKSTFERDGNTMETNTVEIWKLTDKASVLSIDNTSTSPRGERKATYVYDKALPAK